MTLGTPPLRLTEPTPPRPTYRADLPQIEECAPPELIACPQWVAWRYDWNAQRGEWSKVPYNPHTGHKAQSNNAATWGTFEQAKTLFLRLPNAAGVGFCFSPNDAGFVGIDLDDSIASHGGLKPWGEPIAEAINSYTEVSPSGTGVKIFAKANKPPRGRVLPNYHDGQVETYGAGRWFAVTGQRVDDYSFNVEDRLDEYATFYDNLFGDDAPEPTAPTAPAAAAEPSTANVEATVLAGLVQKMLEHRPKAGESDGSKRLYGWACRGVEVGANDAAIIAAVRLAAGVYPFRSAWSDADVVQRIRDAEKVAVRGSDAVDAPLLPSFVTVGQMMDDCPDLRPSVIDGLLREGETMNVISAPKIGKSWLTLALAMSVATGRKWLGTYDVTAGDVLLLDNELHPETLARRVQVVGNALSIPPAEYRDRIVIESLRGRLKDWFQLGSYFAGIEKGRFKIIVCDAFYRFIPKDSNENDNGTMASIYNRIDHYAEMTGSSFVLIHHSSKGIQSEKAVTDVGAGAGAQSRATDTHLVLRHHEEDDVVVLDAAVRSFKPIEAMCLKWSYPVWNPAIEHDPANLRKQNKPRRERLTNPNPAPEIPTDPPPEPWTRERFAKTFLTDQPQDKASVILDATNLTDLSKAKATDLFNSALAKHLIFEWFDATDRRCKRYANVAQPVLATGGQASE